MDILNILFPLYFLFTGYLYYITIFNTEFQYFFTIISLSIPIFYVITYFIFNILSKSFNLITPNHKKIYVVKNYVKSVYLLLICLYSITIIKQVILLNVDLKLAKYLAITYFINDLFALYIFYFLGLITKLPNSTILHHIASSTAGFITLTKIDNTIDIKMLILLYGFFSCMSFVVNMYLGYRVYTKTDWIKYYFVIISYWVYLITLILNWCVQLYLMYFTLQFNIFYGLYILFLIFIGQDDIVLLKYLWNQSNDIWNELKN